MLKHMRQSQTGFAQALAALALLAMALRALLPPGFMLTPVHGGQNFLNVRLCSEHGAVDFVLDPASGVLTSKAGLKRDAPKQAPQSDAPCVFAAMAHMATPVVFAQPGMQAAFLMTFVFQPVAAPQRLGLAAPPPWATGPPQGH